MPTRRDLEQLGYLIDQAFQKAVLLNETTMVYLLSMANLEVSQAIDRMSPKTHGESSSPDDQD